MTESGNHAQRAWEPWANLIIAAILMLATLPGRTQGLGLITEPLLKDFQLDRVLFANLNLWATLLGAVCCLPVGRIIDRWGLRGIGTVVVLGLGATVWLMTLQSEAVVGVFATLFMTRALGQSALSVISITTVGKSFGSRTGLPMGVYAVLLSVLFAAAFYFVGQGITTHGWRSAWRGVAWGLLVVAAPLTALGLRPIATRATNLDGERPRNESIGLSLGEALRTSTFWVFAGATALFGLVAGGLGLFNEAILAEHGFKHDTYYLFLAVTTLIALVGQIGCGCLSTRWPMPRLMALALLLYSASLAAIPLVKTLPQLWLVAVPFGLAGGMITTLFFAVWGEAFGPSELGRIQGAAQMLTVLASAAGPLLFAQCSSLTGSYSPLLFGLSPVILIFALCSYRTRMPASELPRGDRPLTVV